VAHVKCLALNGVAYALRFCFCKAWDTLRIVWKLGDRRNVF